MAVRKNFNVDFDEVESIVATPQKKNASEKGGRKNNNEKPSNAETQVANNTQQFSNAETQVASNPAMYGNAVTQAVTQAPNYVQQPNNIQQPNNAATQMPNYAQQTGNAPVQSPYYAQQPSNAATQQQGYVNVPTMDVQQNIPTQEPVNRLNAVQQQVFAAMGVEAPRRIMTTLKNAVIPRTNGCTYYLEDQHIQSIALIKALNGIDKQDIIRTAVNLFLEKYQMPNGMGLNSEGVTEVEKYLQKLQAGL